MLRKLLTPDISIDVPMSDRFLDEEESLIKLTHEQSMLLRRFGRDRRMVITGCAGSGKTMLGVEQAKWLAREKKLDVLFVCFNKALAQHLGAREGGSGVDFINFHGLCVKLAHEAKLKIDWPDPEDEDQSEFWDDQMPNLLAEAAEALGPRYDAVFIDEAQDFHNHWLTALELLLRDVERSYVWLLMDDSQNVYERTLEVPEEFRPFDLTVNCRNTQSIHREVMKLYKGEVVPEVRGPEGREMELHQTDDQAAKVAEVLQRLCGDWGIPPQDVVVLSSHGFKKSAVAGSGQGSYKLVEKRHQDGKRIHLSSVRGFKGLEAKAVVLCELEDMEHESRDSQLYVGISRAVNHCVVVAPAGT
ncbi:MAG: AAA family ATPase [Thermoleophilaceae bacterium]|nr:AAA family ATPase [Thermoleophilaceae bacterium]